MKFQQEDLTFNKFIRENLGKQEKNIRSQRIKNCSAVDPGVFYLSKGEVKMGPFLLQMGIGRAAEVAIFFPFVRLFLQDSNPH